MNTPVLEVTNLSKNFGGLRALNEVDLTINRQEIVALIGPNGAGKTTFFNCITGIYLPTEGTVQLHLPERNGKPAGTTVSELLSDPDLTAEVDAAIAEANKLVSHAEAIKKYRILPVDFTEETGELTPTMKLKRGVVHESFASDIEQIYSK